VTTSMTGTASMGDTAIGWARELSMTDPLLEESGLDGARFDWDALLQGDRGVRVTDATSALEASVDPEAPPRRPLPARRPAIARPADGRPAPSRPTGSRPRPTAVGYGSRVRPASARRPLAGRPAVKRLHLTRRGRLVLLVVAAVIGFTAFGLGRASADGRAAHSSVVSVVVQPGESLWTIAQRTTPHADPRDVVDRIKALNHLANADVEAGQTLRLR
jgi:hypothetical protein